MDFHRPTLAYIMTRSLFFGFGTSLLKLTDPQFKLISGSDGPDMVDVCNASALNSGE